MSDTEIRELVRSRYAAAAEALNGTGTDPLTVLDAGCCSAGSCAPEAIDVDPVENPYVFGGAVLPKDGTRFADRTDVRPGMAVEGGELVQAFASVGWQWGGRWTGSPDYQHFSTNGK